MAHSDFADLTVDELQSYYSDFHKDFHGWRPRGATPEQWRDRGYLVSSINAIHAALDAMKKTESGRAELRAAGWVIDDEPEAIDPQEYAEWSADADAEFLGRMHSRYAGEMQ
jgi:hypothetical protein